ncbi:hypothetical protein CCR75_008657 [Bremia lactucae]|uniref:Auto-transporter adhesin head GIN domain-containing protein n=1 Tax=Bremia lactucae TaxID=4779 RepID=A0A976IIQ6_BRELC|nr:hypothetical protein CCR75_008657 [Bremia lactucae]
MNFIAALVFAASICAYVNATFTVASSTTEARISSLNHVSHARQWTINAATARDSLNSIDLDLAGRVYVSYASSLPRGVLGYVHVLGDSKSVVNAVTVSNGDADDDDDDDENEGDLHVVMSTSAEATRGYLLTEIVVASSGIVSKLKSTRSAQVVVQDGVLLTSSATEELQIKATGSSAVYVAAPSATVSVRVFQLEAKGTGKLQITVESLTATDKVQLEAESTAKISILSSLVETAFLEVEAEDSSSVCLSASTVKALTYEGEASSRISMPNASTQYSSTGSFACVGMAVPVREPACVSHDCLGSSTESGQAILPQEEVSASVEASVSSFQSFAAVVAASMVAATAVLL